MKKKIVEPEKKEREALPQKKISRKEAIKKSGFIALSAATMLVLLNNPAHASASPAPPPADSSPSRKSNGPWK